MICVLGATYKEISLLLSSLVNVQSLNLGKSCLWQGKIKKQNLIVALTGIGPVNAVHMTTLLLQNYPIKIFILTG
ncbi:MAG TPA: 5'-methylthioadenosine/adenosylhomocysteine nucleosidase, partial [Candidatus Desulfofervidus auxilii]|nr:5'-methylthioadenosine/adenosylhomocysteine nucleosidase [Candidatus Desulfofervidus auxilii]